MIRAIEDIACLLSLHACEGAPEQLAAEMDNTPRAVELASCPLQWALQHRKFVDHGPREN